MNAFSRYERGETPIPTPLSQLLRLLNAHPDLLTELKYLTTVNSTKKNKMATAN